MKNRNGQASLFGVLLFLIVMAVIGVIVILNYNGLVKADKQVDEQKAQIEVVLQRRLELIPNLVETVKTALSHERETLQAVTQARAEAVNALSQTKNKATLSAQDLAVLDASQRELGAAVGRLFAVMESYPQIRGTTNLLALQDQLEGSENRIAVARQRYNTAVRTYNSKIETFPGVILAPLLGYEAREMFASSPAAQQAVEVKF